MDKLRDLTIKKFHRGLLDKKFSALEIAQDFFKYIDVRDKEIDAYLSLRKDEALREAEAVDVALAGGQQIDILSGVPLAIKDNMLIEGGLATAGSKILKAYKAAYDSTVISKLKDKGAVFLGKTNMDEFAMGSSTENSAFKVTKNPHDLTRVPGGSSGGSAAAVASHMAIAALGSDTGGSIRQPASFCGVVGLKPTYGAVSRFGLMAMASSLDQIGPLTKTVEDAAILFKAIAGQDKRDSTSVEKEYGDSLTNPKLEDIKNLTVGIPDEYFIDVLDKEVADSIHDAIKDLESLGIKVKKISLPHTKDALSVYYIIMPAEVSTNLSRFDGIRYGTREKAKNLSDLYFENKGAGFGAEAKRRIILGTFVLSAGYYDAYYSKAQKVRRLIKEDFEKVFESGVDVILTPVAPTPAFKIGEKTDDPLNMYLSDIFTIPLNLAGLPGVSIPVRGGEGKLPVGFQLIGKPFREADILGIG
ncbi:MAG TPA: Asp-tRNA(Asn)/Glu-tRNA(Gln) amidotransferase subunit GatA, partial [Candidatus Paceibacterota bacterium]|nr:Asp-tRNA(Asn)/Glu-tRNA(Gln) amidotransferase subunit GatA [Candidatus Paceibacterota bacterium]